MNGVPVTDPGEDSDNQPVCPFPRLWLLIIFRTALGLLFLIPLVLMIVGVHTGKYTDEEGIAWGYFISVGCALLVSVPSFAIALGLSFRRRWVCWCAIAYDVALTGLVLFFLAQLHTLSSTGVAVLALVSLLILEGAYLSWLAGHGKSGAVVFIVVIGLLVATSVFLPASRRWATHRELQPLVTYASDNWIACPAGWELSKHEFRGSTNIRLSGPDGKSIQFAARRIGVDRWRIDPSRGMNVDVPTVTYQDPGFTRRVRSPKEALALLRADGVKNTDLVYAGVRIDDRPYYLYRSAKAGGIYYVPGIGAGFDLYVDKPVVITR